MGYENKSVLLTGAGSGFGQRLAERLSGMGARLVLGDINEAGLEATKALQQRRIHVHWHVLKVRIEAGSARHHCTQKIPTGW